MHWNLKRPRPGGWRELAITIAFYGLLAVLTLTVTILKGKPPESPLPPDVAHAKVAEAAELAEEFKKTGVTWSDERITDARNQLVILRESLPDTNRWERRAVDAMLGAIIDEAFAERGKGADSSDLTERVSSVNRYQKLQSALQKPIPGHEPMSRGELFRLLLTLFAGLAALYFLYAPFAFLIFLARAREAGYSVMDELIYGWHNLLLSSLLWPSGLETYPENTAEAIRRGRIESEFRIRIGKSWREKLTRAETRQMEALIRLPKTDLQTTLDAIADIPFHVLFRARLAFYVSVVIGFISISSRATAQEKDSDAETSGEKEVAAKVAESEEPSFSLHGFFQVDSAIYRDSDDESEDADDPTLAITRAILIGDIEPHPLLDLRVSGDLAVPKLLEAKVAVKLGDSPISIAGGQFFQRPTYLIPAPAQERLIGGSYAWPYLDLLDIGVELSGKHPSFSWALAGVSGAGGNVADDNAGKDVIAWFATGPFGPLRFQMAWQAGDEPDGFRMRTAGNLNLGLAPFTLDIVGAHEHGGNADALALSSMFAYRVHEHLDLAVGYDGIVEDGLPMNRILRTQATFLAFEDRFRIGAMFRHQRLRQEQAVLGRLQASF